MLFMLIAIVVGIIIGSFTNALAIKMLFRPFNPLKIGNWQIPFTPGLIPKRRNEIAEQLGKVVESYLFTAQGMNQFIEKFGIKDQIFHRLITKLESYRDKNITIGKLLSAINHDDWKAKLKNYGEKKIENLLVNEKIREKTLEELLSEEAFSAIEGHFDIWSESIVKGTREYLYSIEGKRQFEAIVKESLDGKRVIGRIAGMFLESNQLQDMLLSYMDQILSQPKTKLLIQKFIINEWNSIKKEPLDFWLTKLDKAIQTELIIWAEKGLDYLEDISIFQIIDTLDNNNYIEKGYNFIIDSLIKRMDRFFAYLSIAEVVKNEINHFSLEELEKMVIEIAGRELKMITYFGGIIGGLLGLFQGIFYLFFK